MKKYVAIGVATAAISCAAQAELTAEEAKQLGGATLTVLGSEKAGNKEGTIPEYTGKPIVIPGYDPKEPGHRSDPFADDKPLFSITAQNADKYADKLDGQLEMFKKYPNYRMDIYPSRRTVTLPKYVIDNTMKNAAKCKAVQNELVLDGCYGGIPFPVPKTGNQVMWNHLTAYEGHNIALHSMSYIIPPSGAPILANGTTGIQNWPLYDPERTTPGRPNEPYWRVRLDYFSPARQVGEKLVVIDAVDPVNVGRRVYQYIPGQRRVKLAPDLAYDTPSPTAGGAQTMDDSKGFLGAMDRFDFKLIGKKEKFIIYNSFKAADYKACTEQMLFTKNFPNPDCIRYELHRVWVIEAKVKPQYRHIYPKRRFFYDEDGYQAAFVENYDAAGKLFRMIASLHYPYAEGGANFSTFFGYDLNTGLWSAQGPTNHVGGGNHSVPVKSEFYFSPEALAGEGIR